MAIILASINLIFNALVARRARKGEEREKEREGGKLNP